MVCSLFPPCFNVVFKVRKAAKSLKTQNIIFVQHLLALPRPTEKDASEHVCVRDDIEGDI